MSDRNQVIAARLVLLVGTAILIVVACMTRTHMSDKVLWVNAGHPRLLSVIAAWGAELALIGSGFTALALASIGVAYLIKLAAGR